MSNRTDSDGPSASRSRILLLWVSGVLVVSVGVLGLLILQDFNESLEPELQRRATLIGATIRDDTERAVDLGIPLTELVGVEDYFAVFLTEFEELDYLSLNEGTGNALISVGLADGDAEGTDVWRYVGEDETAKSVVHRFALTDGSGEVGSIDVGVDAGYVRSKLDDLALDVAVILIVAMVVAFEVTLAASRRIGTARRRSRRVTAQVGKAESRFPSDIRLVLLVFTIAEELNKSFLPLFIRSADNPTGLATNVTVSLPIVAYLLTMAIASPIAGQLMRSIGERRLFVLGVGSAAASHLGMVFAGNVLQIIGLRSLTGIGYALATIACLDYMLEHLSPGNRARSVAVFVTVVMGGTFAGTALGGIFADRLGYDAVFLISFFMVLGASLAALGVIPAREPDGRPDDRGFKLRDTVQVVKKPSLFVLLAGVTIPMNVLMAAFLWYLVPLVMADLGSDASAIARTLMIYYLVILVGGPSLARIAGKRIDLWFLVGAGSVLSASILLLPAVQPTALTISVAVLVVGLGHAAIRGPQIALALDIADADLPAGGRDAALAAMRSLERLGSLVGLLAVAVVASAFDFEAAIGVVGIAAAAAGLVFIGSSRLRPRRSHG